MTTQETAKSALDALDAFMSGQAVTPEQSELAASIGIAGLFAGAAFEAFPFKGGGEYHALARTFLLALADPSHPDLDYLRADPKSGDVARSAADWLGRTTQTPKR